MTFRRLILRQKFAAIAALFVIVGIGASLVAQGSVAKAWDQATARQSEHYTSLAFLDTGHLPSYSGAGKVQHITFRITNHEATTTTYQYRASLSTGSSVALLTQGTVTLLGGQSTDQTLAFTLPRPDMRGQVLVQLVDHSEYITFETKS